MRVACIPGDVRSVRADMVVVNLFEGEKRPGGATAAVDAAIGGGIASAIRDGDFRGNAAPRVLVVGLGKKEKFTADQARQAALPVVKLAKKLKLSSVASVVHGAGAGGVDPRTAAQFCALGASLSAFEFDRYKSEKGHRVSR